MPQGVDWTPLDEALARLRDGLHCVVEAETVPLADAGGRVLASDVIAQASNPPFPNSAVDGYGFAFASLQDGDIHMLDLADGRSAAGAPFEGAVAGGGALRILTGARVPEGVDTVVLEEDTALNGNQLSFRHGLRQGANTRKKGEDFAQGDVILHTGQRLRSQDLGLLAAAGVDVVSCYQPLRVAVLSTGDEISGTIGSSVINDANRPMLMDMIRRWNAEVVDLGAVPDDPKLIKAALDNGAAKADVILTTGGASAGDEDHISKLLSEEGKMQTWRIAVKPGRPLALALWQGQPVFGLPGNPVAAFVCSLIFAAPAFAILSGQGWREPKGQMVKAAFSKNKKAGRREYLRARLNQAGQAEVFKSEGSGRISGLSWAEGLVELPDAAVDISNGSLVKYIPFREFGL